MSSLKNNQTKQLLIKIMSIIAILMLAGTLADNPYGYYILLRWVVFISSIALAFTFKSMNRESWLVIFSVIAFLFNPLVPVHLNKQLWIILDLITAGIFLISIFKLKNNNKRFPSQ